LKAAEVRNFPNPFHINRLYTVLAIQRTLFF
jgi:hypothetical protein